MNNTHAKYSLIYEHKFIIGKLNLSIVYKEINGLKCVKILATEVFTSSAVGR